ncbi:MAG: phosphate ABC transporter permease subunit PstC [bacterium]
MSEASDRPAARLRLRWRGSDRLFGVTTATFALAVAAVFAVMVVMLAQRSSAAWHAFGPSFLWQTGTYTSESDIFHGARPYLYGTLVTSLLALVFAVPVAVGTAVALVELMPRWLAQPVGLFIELLAAVPSIIFGIWGVAVIVPFVHSLNPTLTGQSLLSAALVLAIMVLPIMTAVTRDMLKAVPRAQREAALALGATPWEVTWRIVLPNARSGITAAAILGLGRATGETMAVIMVIGFKPEIYTDLFQGGATMASVIASDFGEAHALQKSALIEIGVLMLVVSLVLSVSARLVVRRLGRRMSA